MAIQDLIEYLSYSKCDCGIDYREKLGVINGVCPKHPNSVLLVKGIRADVFMREAEKRRLIDRTDSKVV